MIKTHPTHCAICNTENNATELYPENFKLEDFNPVIFSARRLPDRIHYRIVKCKSCGLVRSDPVVSPEVMADLYMKSNFSYSEDTSDLRLTYGYYLSKLARYGVQKSSLLEIGCGNGFFLEEALLQKYNSVAGVEPSADAVKMVKSGMRRYIVSDIMKPGLFESERFSVICMFQVLDHIPDPGSLFRECFRILKPGGLLLCINHNIEALSAKLLKERSPIIDIEHVYLYSPDTISRIFTASGFNVKCVGSVRNRYTVYYLMRFLPLSIRLKDRILSLLKDTFFGHIRLSLPLGNLYAIAQKPELAGVR